MRWRACSRTRRSLDHYNHQPEFTLSWAQYRALVVTDQRAEAGRAAVQHNAALIQAVEGRYGVGPGVVVGIWGLESSFGEKMGDYSVIEALATLAWKTGVPTFFRSELIDALRILDPGDITPERMIGQLCRRDGPTAVHAVILSPLRR